MTNAKHYEHRFSNGTILEAFSLDSKLDPGAVVRQNLKNPPIGAANLETLAGLFPVAFDVSGLSAVKTRILDEPYEIPKILVPFAEAVIAEKLARNPSMFPGPIIAYSREGDEMLLRWANYFHFLATNGSFDRIPANYAGNPNKLPEGKTLIELVEEEKVVTRKQMVNYLGQAFFVIAGGKLGFVQRAANLGIAAGVPAVPGGTPPFVDYHTIANKILKEIGVTKEQIEIAYANAGGMFGPRQRYAFVDNLTTANRILNGIDVSQEQIEIAYANAREMLDLGSDIPFGFFAPNFSFARYIEEETAKEMGEEFLLEKEEFRIVEYRVKENGTRDPNSTPFIATVIETPLSWSQIADRCYGNLGVIKEHPMIYAVEANPRAFETLVDGMAMLDSTACVGYQILKSRDGQK